VPGVWADASWRRCWRFSRTREGRPGLAVCMGSRAPARPGRPESWRALRACAAYRRCGGPRLAWVRRRHAVAVGGSSSAEPVTGESAGTVLRQRLTPPGGGNGAASDPASGRGGARGGPTPRTLRVPRNPRAGLRRLGCLLQTSGPQRKVRIRRCAALEGQDVRIPDHPVADLDGATNGVVRVPGVASGHDGAQEGEERLADLPGR